jgi:hypothetical protein
MLHASKLCSLVVLAAVFGACKNEDPEGAEALWDEIHDADYTAWDRAPGYPERAPSSVHGREMDLFVNDVVADALAAGEPLDAWPDGSVIVKDGYDGGKLTLVAVMAKQDGAWFWAEYQETGEVDASGSPRVCLNCHESGGDYVRAFPLPQ